MENALGDDVAKERAPRARTDAFVTIARLDDMHRGAIPAALKKADILVSADFGVTARHMPL